MKSGIAIVLLCLATMISFGQSTPSYNIPNSEEIVKIPPSPEVKAFDKYGNTPVNTYTGTTDISVPIATLEGRAISIPINLRYDASGIKVDQIATWVGLGWNLDIGGAVTRQAVGLPDDYFSGNSSPDYYPFYQTYDNIASDINFVSGFSPLENSIYSPGQLKRYFDFMKKIVTPVANEKIEYQPDTYSFNALGISGTMLIDYSTLTANCLEHPEYKVIPSFSAQGNPLVQVITGWTIIDATGNAYYFEQIERTRVLENNSNDDNREYNSSWLLTKIESTNKRDTVLFTYNTAQWWTQEQLAGHGVVRVETVNGDMNGIPSGAHTEPDSMPTYMIKQGSLQYITINGKMLAELNESAAGRTDLVGRKSLSEILVLNQQGSQVQSHKFYYSYFGNPGETDEKKLRLRLDKIELHGSQTLITPPTHYFEYNGTVLPSRESYGQDFWGYNNGQTNSTLIPYDYDLDVSNVGNDGFQGANRNPDLSWAQTGSISKITYPTGGSTEFTYALHRSAEIVSTDHLITEVFNRSVVGGASSGSGDVIDTCEPDDLSNSTISSHGFHTTGGSHRFVVQANGTTDAYTSQRRRFIAIYKMVAPLDTISPCDIAANAGVLNSDPNMIYIPANMSSSWHWDMTLELGSGFYTILIINSDPLVTIGVDVVKATTVDKYDVGGLRIRKLVDKDETGAIASRRYYYYDDLSLISPASITEAFLESADSTSGTLHDTPQFEDVQTVTALYGDDPSAFYWFTYYNTSRFCENRTRANHHVTYPFVSEIQFSNTGASFNGYTVSEFENITENYVNGYRRNAILNGRAKEKRVYDNTGLLLRKEQTFNSKDTLGSVQRFFFTSTESNADDIYIKSALATPSQEFFTYREADAFRVGSGWSDVDCTYTGIETIIFGETDGGIFIHTGVGNPDAGNACDGTHFNPNHPAVQEYNLLVSQGAVSPGIYHSFLTANVAVSRKLYNVYACYDVHSRYTKGIYNYYRFWTKVDSVRTIDYLNGQSITSTSKSFYENTSHYQVTRSENIDSKGVLHKANISYAHEMHSTDPSNTIWSGLITANRIAEPVMKNITYGSNQPDFKQLTLYRAVGSMIVADQEQFSSGGSAFETRIRYVNYDVVGNPIEVARENDNHLSYVWSHNKQYPVAKVANAASNEIFFTSFEEIGEGNSTSGDSKTGLMSKTGGFTKTLSNLTANIPYTLTYWQKSSGTWSLQTVDIAASSSTSYSISLTGQVDEVRFHPKYAMMTSFTYSVPVGQLSTNDPNNQITFYEYDTLGRLKAISDYNGNRLKSYQYHYKGGSGN
jgi:YD repeat-containing protein